MQLQKKKTLKKQAIKEAVEKMKNEYHRATTILEERNKRIGDSRL